ncbi:MAG: AAA family ATPase [Bacillota bacterium]
MRILEVRINRFRSIQSAELCNCGNLNILVGKNNSGKSNILSAINAFFEAIHGGRIANLEPPVGQDGIDFFKKETDSPIEITLVLVPTADDVREMIRDIVEERPQVRAVAEALNMPLALSVTLTVKHSPASFAYVSQVSVRTNGTSSERTILRIDEGAAAEIYTRLIRAGKARSEAASLEGLLRIDPEEWEFLAQRERRVGLLPHRLRSLQLRPDTMKSLESLSAGPLSYADFRKGVEALIAKELEEAEAMEREPLGRRVTTFSGEESAIPGYVQNLLRKISRVRVLYVREQRQPIGKDEAQQLLDLKVTRGGPDRLRSFQETVRGLLGVTVDAFRGGPSPASRREAAAEMDVDEFLVEVNGSGIREALRLILDVEFKQPNVLLIEEPEIHLHPGLETVVMDYLKTVSSKCQVFLSTHSTNFLDRSGSGNIYMVSKEQATTIRLVDSEEAEAEVLEQLGVRLSSLLLFDRILFVEGPSDEEVLRHWAKALNVNLARLNVGFVHLRGARNFGHFAAAETLSFLRKRQAQMWFLIDRDELDESAIEKLRNTLGDLAVLKVLERRELENYLVVPRAIAAFIREKRSGLDGKGESQAPSLEEVTKAIDECADQLKELVIEKRVARTLCKPIYLDPFGTDGDLPFGERVVREVQRAVEVLNGIQTQLEHVREQNAKEVDELWPRNKMALVPGSVLLDKVCSRFGVRFRKRRDAGRLASLMAPDEIAAEMRDFLTALAGTGG